VETLLLKTWSIKLETEKQVLRLEKRMARERERERESKI
jgi:hypothetical protein